MGKLGILELKDKCYRELSGGQQQRVLLARALCAAGDLLVLDEPQNGLDPTAVHEFRQHILALQQEGMTVILSSHILSELYLLATDFIFIHHGRILRTMSKEALDEQCVGGNLEEFFFSLVGGEGT